MHFDLVIIGAGPGGYVAAIRASQLGMKVALVDRREKPGGTCLNVGCIPSKALLHSAYKYSQAKDEFHKHGIEVTDVRVNVKTMIEHKNHVVSELTGGVNFLLKKNKVTVFHGTASLGHEGDQTVVHVHEGSEVQVLHPKHTIIATGSQVIDIPTLPTDEKMIVSSTGALDLEKVPAHMVVVGGGYIGLELGSVWKRLGSDVTVVEALPEIAMSMDHDVRKELRKSLESLGIKFMLNTKVIASEKQGKKIHVEVVRKEDLSKPAEVLSADVVLVSVGRKPCTDGLNLEHMGIHTNERGFIHVNHHFETSRAGVYAIGDVIGGMMLAHKAEEEGIALVEMLAGQKGHVNYDVIPAVIFTQPEVASVGLTEEQAKERGHGVKVGKFPFSANSLAKAISSTEGFVKIIADSRTDRVLGVHIIGSHAGAMIQEAAMAMEFGASSEDIARTCHAHPTFSEALKEAAWDTFEKALHK